MARGKNTFNFSGGFNINSQEPIDSRFVVGLLSDLTSSATWTSDQLYNGLVVAVEESGKLYILRDRDNYQDEDSWSEVGGSGKGTVIVPTYNDASVYAVPEGKGQLIYVEKTTYRLIDPSTGQEYGDYTETKPEGTEGTDYHTYPSGAYISNGGSIDKMAQSTASGSIESEVQELQSKVGELTEDINTLKGDASTAGSVQKTVADAIAVEDASMKAYVDSAVEAAEQALADIDASIAELESDKLDKDAIDASTLKFTDDKLTVKVKAGTNALKIDASGNGLYVEEFDASVKGVKDGEHIISLGSDGMLDASLSINYDSSAKRIQLLGRDASVLSEIDATDFIKDGMIDSVELVVNPAGEPAGTYLKIVFNTESGKEPILVNVTSLIDVYAAGNGLQLDGKTFSVKVSTNSEEFLSVDSTGIKVTGVQDAIDTAISALNITGLRNDVSLNTQNIADVSTLVNGVLEQYVKSVSVAADSSNLISATTTNGNVEISIKDALQNVVSGFADKVGIDEIVEGSTNGTIKVRGTDIAVHGLGSAAYTESTDYLANTALDWITIS